MKTLSTQPNLVEQVRDAILAEIVSRQFAPGARIIQEDLARPLGVSRQPVQQALLLLRKEGLLHEAPGRGLLVAPIDADHAAHIYDLRAVIEGLAARCAAKVNAERAAKLGPAFIDAGRKAVAARSVAKMIAADRRFHEFIYELSGNPIVAQMMSSHWIAIQRVMGEVLVGDEKARDIWSEHAEILDAIAAGKAARAEQAARRHIMDSAAFMVARLRGAAAVGT